MPNNHCQTPTRAEQADSAPIWCITHNKVVNKIKEEITSEALQLRVSAIISLHHLNCHLVEII